MTKQGAVDRLVAEIDRYLARLEGPGIAEVRAGIARFGRGPHRKVEPNPPACGHFEAAISSIGGEERLSAAVAAIGPELRWMTYDAYPRQLIGERFPRAHAFASLIGGAGFFPADDFELGLFIIAPRTLYRDHCHKAPELYVPLTGPHEWRFGAGETWTKYAAHRPVWNEPMRVHATLVRDMPFLSLFAWTKDVDAVATVVPAGDWDAIEGQL